MEPNYPGSELIILTKQSLQTQTKNSDQNVDTVEENITHMFANLADSAKDHMSTINVLKSRETRNPWGNQHGRPILRAIDINVQE